MVDCLVYGWVHELYRVGREVLHTWLDMWEYVWAVGVYGSSSAGLEAMGERSLVCFPLAALVFSGICTSRGIRRFFFLGGRE